MAHPDLEPSRRVVLLPLPPLSLSLFSFPPLLPSLLLWTAPSRRLPRISLRMVLLLVAAFFAFKAMLLAVSGAATYDERVARLEAGTTAEAAGAWIMQSDPLTEVLAGQITRWLP